MSLSLACFKNAASILVLQAAQAPGIVKFDLMLIWMLPLYIIVASTSFSQKILLCQILQGLKKCTAYMIDERSVYRV
jgi:hypothetical protein